MKTITYTCICLFFLNFIACKKNTGTNQDAGDKVIGRDSIQKVHIDSLNDQILKELRDSLVTNKIPYPLYNIEDTIYYWFNNDYSGQISIELEPNEGVKWPLFYFYKGEMIKVRYRGYDNTPGKSLAFESHIYLNKEKIIYCDERGGPLADGEMPGMIRQLPFAPSTKSSAELKSYYEDIWHTIYEIITAHDPKLKVIKP